MPKRLRSNRHSSPLDTRHPLPDPLEDSRRSRSDMRDLRNRATRSSLLSIAYLTPHSSPCQRKLWFFQAEGPTISRRRSSIGVEVTGGEQVSYRWRTGVVAVEGRIRRSLAIPLEGCQRHRRRRCCEMLTTVWIELLYQISVERERLNREILTRRYSVSGVMSPHGSSSSSR
jgi:hypothetical protein